ncbi:NHL repeat protein, partial [Ostertagia ostertagi]
MCNFDLMSNGCFKENPFSACGGAMQQSTKVGVGAAMCLFGFGLTLDQLRDECLIRNQSTSEYPFGVVEVGAITDVDGVKLGQVAGLTFLDGNVVIFHRAGRNWDQNTFDQYNVLLDKTPINDDVIVIAAFNENKAHMVNKLGKNKFYLPHGIHFGKDGFLYTTDVGAHTVAKWKINGN